MKPKSEEQKQMDKLLESKPFKILGFYISRTDWETKCWLLNQLRDGEYKMLQQKFSELESKLSKYEKPRDAKGRFISKQDLMTAELRAEVNHKQACEAYEHTENIAWGNYDDIKQASKL